MRSDLYWEERALQREEYARRTSTRVIKTKTVKLYAKAQKDLDARINRIFSRYAANGELTPEEARRMLNTKEAEAELEALRKELNNIKDPVIKRKALARLNAPAYAARINRLEALKANIETETALLADREKRELKRLLEDVSGDTYYRSIYDTQIGTGLGFEFSALSKGAVNTIVNDRWKGANFSDRIWQNTSALANSAYGIVARGIMTGAGPQVMARQLADAMQSGMYSSMRLIRTETNRVHNAAEKVAYEEEGITEYRFLATLDGRTCDVCGALDGKTFPVSEAKEGINYPPLHPNDRCTTVAARTDQELAALKRRARDPETGETKLVPASMTYEEWLARLDNVSEDGIIKSIGKDVLPVSKPKARSDKSKVGSNLLTKEQKASLLAFEKHHREEVIESAYCVNPYTGEFFEKTSDSSTFVVFTKEEQVKMRGCILSHNHSNNAEFSPNDIFQIYHLGLSEMRASVDGGAFVIRATPKTIWHRSLQSLSNSLNDCTKDKAVKYFQLLQEGQISFVEYDSLASQAGVEEFARRYRYSYFFEEIGEND
jgi:SPP1 gp7 family putative phage head morphogenesis protein